MFYFLILHRLPNIDNTLIQTNVLKIGRLNILYKLSMVRYIDKMINFEYYIVNGVLLKLIIHN